MNTFIIIVTVATSVIAILYSVKTIIDTRKKSVNDFLEKRNSRNIKRLKK